MRESVKGTLIWRDRTTDTICFAVNGEWDQEFTFSKTQITSEAVLLEIGRRFVTAFINANEELKKSR